MFLKNKYLKPDLHSSSRDPLSRCKTTTVFISSTELGALQDFWTQLIFAVANIKRGAILKQNQSAPVAVFGYLTLILSAQTCSSAPERQNSRTNNNNCFPLRAELEALASPSVWQMRLSLDNYRFRDRKRANRICHCHFVCLRAY